MLFRACGLVLEVLESASQLLNAEIVLFNDIEAEARQLAGHHRRIIRGVR